MLIRVINFVKEIRMHYIRFLLLFLTRFALTIDTINTGPETEEKLNLSCRKYLRLKGLKQRSSKHRIIKRQFNKLNTHLQIIYVRSSFSNEK